MTPLKKELKIQGYGRAITPTPVRTENVQNVPSSSKTQKKMALKAAKDDLLMVKEVES